MIDWRAVGKHEFVLRSTRDHWESFNLINSALRSTKVLDTLAVLQSSF